MTADTLQGLFTALITPFRNGKVDEDAFRSFIEWQIEEGVHGLVPTGTTGESPTLSHDEHKRVVEICVKAARGRVKVMAGTGSNNTEEAIDFTRHAQKAGADAALIVAPYYNKPTQEGIYRHYKTIHDASDLPIVIYNIPGRSGIDIKDETLARLAELPRIVGVKDATGDLARVSTLRATAGKDFILLSGEDMTAVGFNAMGGRGCISVTANVAPKHCAKVQQLTLAGHFAEALTLHDTMTELHSAMFCETSPGPVKYAASRMGKCLADIRLPLVPPSAESQARIERALSALKLM